MSGTSVSFFQVIGKVVGEFMRSVHHLLFVLPVLAAACFLCEAVFSQTQEESRPEAGEATPSEVSPSDPRSKRAEKLEVTGSRIKTTDVEGASPIITIGREQIEMSGAATVGEILKDETVNSFGSEDNESGGKDAGMTNIDLRGLGRWRTLVLVNGRRLPKDPENGGVDTNLIPADAVERIEIMTDSGSAVYGSDAIGGVVNIITKKDYEMGTDLKAYIKKPQRKGSEFRSYSYTTRVATEKFRSMAILQYEQSMPLLRGDRDVTAGLTSDAGYPGSYTAGGVSYPAADCPADRIKTNSTGTFCEWSRDGSMYRPKKDQFSLIVDLERDISDSLSLFSYVMMSEQRVEYTWDPNSTAGATTTDLLYERDYQTIPAARASTLGEDGGPLPGATATDDVSYRYAFKELGPKQDKSKTNNIYLLGGLRGEFGLGYEWELAAFGSRYHKVLIGADGYGLKSELKRLIVDAPAGEGFNPMAPEGQRGSLDLARHNTYDEMLNSSQGADFKISGPIVDLPAGSLDFAAGLEVKSEEIRREVDYQSSIGNVLGNDRASRAVGDRELKTGFLELKVPVVNNLDFTGAVRHDNYSDFGSWTSPRGALRWQPISPLLFRGSYGLGFKAPDLTDLHKGLIGSDRDVTINEVINGESVTYSVPGSSVFKGGNPDLKQEKSRTLSLGTVFAPSSSLALHGTYWRLWQENAVSTAQDPVIDAVERGQELSSYGILIERDTTGRISRMVVPVHNIGRKELVGYDLKLETSTPKAAWGRIFFDSTHSTQISHKYKGFSGSPEFERIGTFKNPRWQNSANLRYNYKGYSMNLRQKVVASHGGGSSYDEETGTTSKFDKIPLYREYDLGFSAWVLKDGRVNVGCQNFTDVKPPARSSYLYDYEGRTYTASYTQKL